MIRKAWAAMSMLPVLGFMALMAGAIAIDIACGRGEEWPS